MSYRVAFVLGGFAVAALGGCSIEERTDRDRPEPESTRRQIIQPEGVARLPVFSSAVRSGDLIFLSGALGALPGVSPPQMIEGGIEAETRQVHGLSCGYRGLRGDELGVYRVLPSRSAGAVCNGREWPRSGCPRRDRMHRGGAGGRVTV